MSCAGGPPEPQPLPVLVTTSSDLNPTRSGRVQNVDVMVFQLLDLDAFNNVDLLDLYPTKEAAQAALGASIVSMARYQFTPSEDRTLELDVDPKTRYLGVIAAFEQYHKAQWRASVQLQDESLKDKVMFRDKRVRVALDSLSVSMQLGK